MVNINPLIEESWMCVLQEEFNAPYFKNLKLFLLDEKTSYTIYPPGSQIFAAFNITPFQMVKVVIIGQDPYHGKGQAHGLCFSVPDGIPQPPSLINIFKELHNDMGYDIPVNGNLEKWALQGVLLLNATLTVRANQAGSHQNQGWEIFTDKIIQLLSEQRDQLIFILWGSFAKAKEPLINKNKHFIRKAAHPSPFSANKGFFGCSHFSKTNEILRRIGKEEIDWSL